VKPIPYTGQGNEGRTYAIKGKNGKVKIDR
jgi:hypothetical protein